MNIIRNDVLVSRWTLQGGLITILICQQMGTPRRLNYYVQVLVSRTTGQALLLHAGVCWWELQGGLIITFRCEQLGTPGRLNYYIKMSVSGNTRADFIIAFSCQQVGMQGRLLLHSCFCWLEFYGGLIIIFRYWQVGTQGRLNYYIQVLVGGYSREA